MIASKRFYIIRHGQTVTNEACIMAGQTNAQLTELGRNQAKAARKVVEALKTKPSLIVHSHLDRAKDTALTINKNMNLKMIEEKEISEINVGEWEGEHFDKCLEMFNQNIDPPGGETLENFMIRTTKSISEHCNLHPSPILFVCHGGVMRMVAEKLKSSIRADKFLNCHLYEFEPIINDTKTEWKIWQYDTGEDGNIKRNPSPFFK